MQSVGHRNFRKLQSAMEYLTTYGWAILIVCIGLATLYQLGVFNSTNFSPKAPPGSCEVSRPEGPGTTTLMTFQGLCVNELPEYVARFNGVSGYVALKNSMYCNFTSSNSRFSIAAWFKTSKTTGTLDIVARGACASPAGPGYKLELVSGDAKFLMINTANAVIGAVTSSQSYSDGKWHFIVGIDSSANLSLYVDEIFIGNFLISPPAQSVTPNSNYTIGYSFAAGSTGCGSEYFNGSVSNVQVYNTSLTFNAVQALYIQGIGAIPVNLQKLAGWWPLNGDTNDYSGNANNAASYGIGFGGS